MKKKPSLTQKSKTWLLGITRSITTTKYYDMGSHASLVLASSLVWLGGNAKSVALPSCWLFFVQKTLSKYSSVVTSKLC